MRSFVQSKIFHYCEYKQFKHWYLGNILIQVFPPVLKCLWECRSQLFRNYSQTEVKQEQRNLTISGKNYLNTRSHSYCYYDNDERWRRNKYISDWCMDV